MSKKIKIKGLPSAGISNIKFLARGKRGVIHTGILIFRGKRIKVAIKSKLPESRAESRIENEGKWLKLVNKKGIGPQVIKSSKNYVMYKFIEGDFLLDFVSRSDVTKEQILDILKNIFGQLYVLDMLGVNKGEMHHPVKHIIVEEKLVRNKTVKGDQIEFIPMLIDFERCYESHRPKNVTQFCQFFLNGKIRVPLEQKGIFVDKELLLERAKEYKKRMTETKLNKITELFC